MRVQINRLCVESDVNLIVGPVFPHEVVGFSGGNKYFFPGCLVQVIASGAPHVETDRYAVAKDTACGRKQPDATAFAATEVAWAALTKICAQTHFTHVDNPYLRIVGLVPEMYDDIWTGAKGFYT